ncbi:MAG: VCBS repeat-containing protein, partial [Chloroflexaceae bacterium]|nr:VCBS repeat-containing protein [Chloroflexaceae bacterium]
MNQKRLPHQPSQPVQVQTYALLRVLLLATLLIAIALFAARLPRPVQAQDISPFPAWSSAENDSTTSVAWGDVDSDGDLDLAVGNRLGSTRLYLSEQGTLFSSPAWNSYIEYRSDVSTSSVAWGDVDSDGDLDLAVGDDGDTNRLYRNDQGTLTTEAVWS